MGVSKEQTNRLVLNINALRRFDALRTQEVISKPMNFIAPFQAAVQNVRKPTLRTGVVAAVQRQDVAGAARLGDDPAGGRPDLAGIAAWGWWESRWPRPPPAGRGAQRGPGRYAPCRWSPYRPRGSNRPLQPASRDRFRD